jgi:TolB-like protein/tetratricopeptide (TPR) repeat protein
MGLNSAMRKLRDALGDSADHPTYIETLPRRGYRLIAAVKVNDPLAAEPGPQIVASPARHRRTLLWVSAVAGFAALTLVTTARFHKPATPLIRSIAVLPLANLSSDRSQEYFADGMTEALITDLAQLRDVRVISRTSVMPYKETKKSLPEIARDLHVDGIVEGGVLRSGGRVRITVQLIHAATDHHIWARSYERDMSDVVTLQREIAGAITEALRAELTPDAVARIRTPRPVNPEAYEFFLIGIAAAGKENTQGFTDAIAYFEKATEKQNDFALAYAAMSRCYSQFAWAGSVAPGNFMRKAKEAALKAIDLDPGLAEAHAEMGRVLYQYDWNWARSEQEIRRALELNPNDARTHRGYAALLRATGRVKEANAEAQRVHELDPLWARTPGGVLGNAAALRSSGNYEQAIVQMRNVLKMDPALFRAHFQLGLTLADAGRLNESITELETAVQLSQKNLRFRAGLAWAYALAGRETEARRILADLRARSQRDYVSPVAMAMIHLGLNETEPALQLLEQAYEQRDFDLVLANKSTTFRSLRAAPRFRELMRKIGLPEA